MRVIRGRAASIEADRAATADLAAAVAETGEPALRVWYPPRQLAFGRRDARADGYDRARERAADLGYPPVERSSGGRAVVFTGGVLAVAHAEPADVGDPAIDDRYERASETLESALRALGLSARRGEPPDSFCPGTHSLRTDDGKVAGLAQRVRRGVGLVAGAVVVDDAATVASVLDSVYDALGVPFDPGSVDSLAARSDDPLDRTEARARIEAAFVGDRPTTAVNVRDT